MTADASTRAVIERYLLEVLSGRQPDAAEDLVVDPRLRQSLRSLQSAFGPLEVIPNVLVTAGEYGAVHVSSRGTHRGMYQGLAPTGRPWIAASSAIYRVADGRIVDSWVTWDALAILEQIGAVRRPPGSSA